MGNDFALFFASRHSGKSFQHTAAKVSAAEDAVEKNRDGEKKRYRFNQHGNCLTISHVTMNASMR